MQPAGRRQDRMMHVDDRAAIFVLERRQLMGPVPIEVPIVVVHFDVLPTVREQPLFDYFYFVSRDQNIYIRGKPAARDRQASQRVCGSLEQNNRRNDAVKSALYA